MGKRALFSLLLAGCASGSPATPPDAGATGAGELGAAARRPRDANGVVLAGGETSDFGGGDSDPTDCQDVATTEFTVDGALAAGLPVEDAVALLQREFEAPFHWGYCDESCADGAASSEDTRLLIRPELLSIFRTARAPGPAYPEEQCADEWVFRTVLDLATRDGAFAGRFYARLEPRDVFAGAALVIIDAIPDLTNFQGTLGIPVDLGRPHWSGVYMRMVLSETEFWGSFDVEINYSDDSLPPERHGAGGFWPVAGPHQPYFQGFSREPAPAPVGAVQVAADDYPGSVETPTCLVHVSAGVQNAFSVVDGVELQGYPLDAVDAELSVNGDAVGVMDMFRSQGLPAELRLDRGTSLRIQTRSLEPEGKPFAFIGAPPFLQTDYCLEPGCVAAVEHRLDDYCSR